MAETMQDYTGASCDWYDAPCHITSTLQWVYNFAQWVPMKIFEKVCDNMGDMVAAIPVPSFFAQAQTGLQQIPPGVAFFLDHAQLPTGIGIVLSAYLIRFAIRRLPIVG